MLIAVLFTLISLAGLARFRNENRAEELWVPQGTIALRDQKYVDSIYPDETRLANLLFVRRNGDGNANVVSRDNLLEMTRVVGIGEKVRAESGGIEDRCKRTKDTEGNELCLSISPLSVFYNPNNIVKMDGESGLVNFSESVRRELAGLKEEDIKTRLSESQFEGIDGGNLEREDLVGSVTGAGSSIQAEAFLYRLVLNNNLTFKNGEDVDENAEEWEEEFTTTLLDASKSGSNELKWFVDSFWGREDSLSQVLSGDLPLLSGGFALLFIFVVLFLGDFHAVRSRMVCGIFGLLTAGLALGTMFGLSSLFGMFYSPVGGFLPFLILGIAADDVFIVTRTLNNINREERTRSKSAQKRIALALSESGSAITVTSFTNTLVFLIGSITNLPSLRFFSLWAAIGIFAAWVYTITFYTAYLTIDQRRMDSGRYDCFPCKKSGAIKERNWFRQPPGSFSRFMENYFGPFVMKKPVAFVILTLIIGLFGLSIWRTSRLYRKFKFSFFYSEGTSQFEYQEAFDANFPDKQGVRVFLRDIDYGLESNQRKMLDLCKDGGLIEKDATIDPESVDCWYTAFRSFQNITDEDSFIPQETFVSDLQEFLKVPAAARFDTDIIFDKGGTKIKSSRFSAEHVPLESNSDQVDAMNGFRETIRRADIGRDGEDAFPYTFIYTFYEQYAALPKEIGLSLGLSLVAVAIVSCLLIGHPIVAIVCFVSVLMILVDLLGFVNYTDTQISSVSAINLVIATGLSVDTVAHICRGFLEKIGDRRTRAIHSLRDLGQPVFYASVSTFLAIVMLAGAKSYVFKVFFRLFVAIIVFGLLHGFLFAPIVLRFIGPRAFYETKEEKEEVARHLEELCDSGSENGASGKETSDEDQVVDPSHVNEETA